MTPHFVAHALIALLPQRLKVLCYRVFFKYKIGAGVRIGFSIVDAAQCEIGDDVRIGHGNLICQVGDLSIGRNARIGFLNIIRGGVSVTIGTFADIRRSNEINAIINPRVENVVDPTFILGHGSLISNGHKIDFTDRVEIGNMAVLGGRNSSLWTHSRQQAGPITIGAWSYIGSEVRMGPLSSVPAWCLVGMGSVVVTAFHDKGTLIAGVPAKVMRPLKSADLDLLAWESRPDLPPGFAAEHGCDTAPAPER